MQAAARRVAGAEAKKSGRTAVVGGRHGSHVTGSSRDSVISRVVRVPPQYGSRDVELLLDTLWAMFTQSQAERLVVSVPWDDSDDPRQIVLADLVALLEDRLRL